MTADIRLTRDRRGRPVALTVDGMDLTQHVRSVTVTYTAQEPLAEVTIALLGDVTIEVAPDRPSTDA